MMHASTEHNCVTPDHLRRDAFVYIRQSTLQQVLHNTESTKRQYALRDRAMALGWPAERVHIVDADLGLSGASAADRMGFQQLVAEVGLGKAGIVLGLEVSRLARNSSDWHRLLEICALSGTLILDEEGLYDPSQFNDRLLLGLKGTMSEAELHVIRSRLVGGMRNKARRGELRMALPVGLVYDGQGRVVRDPDLQVQNTLQIFFDTFHRTQSAAAVYSHFRQHDIPFPRRLRIREQAGNLVWGPLLRRHVVLTLRNPRYSGAYVWGRTKSRKMVNGTYHPITLEQKQWQVVLPESHAGYITWDQYQHNVSVLRDNGRAYGPDRCRASPQDGPALLAGMVLCGLCGNRMKTSYHDRNGKLMASYSCHSADQNDRKCQTMVSRDIDRAISGLILDAVKPENINLACAVHDEIRQRQAEVERLLEQQVKRTLHEVRLARDRYMRVDPGNRLVADSLESDWNARLREQREAEERLEEQRKQNIDSLKDEARNAILDMAGNFSKLWDDQQIGNQDRKRIARLIIEDVTLSKGEQVLVQVRYKSGMTKSLRLEKPKNGWQQRETPAEVIRQVDQLLDVHTDRQVAAELNALGVRSGLDREYNDRMVEDIRRKHGLASTEARLLRNGYIREADMASRLQICTATVRSWRKQGLVHGQLCNDKGQYLYRCPEEGNIPRKQQGRKLTDRISAPVFDGSCDTPNTP
jgi:DNA invertase Pin-like site-specific DNA recombinase